MLDEIVTHPVKNGAEPESCLRHYLRWSQRQLRFRSISQRPECRSIGIVSEIAKKEGVIGLYKGLSPAIIRHMFYTPIRIIGYENLKGFIVRSEGINNGESLPLATKALVGGISGVIAQVVASPADLVKVRMQADGRLVSQGLKPRYSGPIEAFTKIIQSEGVKGLWKGVLPNIQRAFLVNMGELACYDHAKHFVIEKKISKDKHLRAHSCFYNSELTG